MRLNPIVNALTIDVEDYFQVHALSSKIRREDWSSFESRVEKNTFQILDLLDLHRESYTRDYLEDERPYATFFVLGWIADRYPNLVKEIHKRGYEVACHGYAHQLIFSQTNVEFREDVRRAKSILEDLIGDEVIGYRAPTFSITKGTLWALRTIERLGFRYDSSIFPVRHDVYGFPDAPRFPFLVTFVGKDGHEMRPLDGDTAISLSALGTNGRSYKDSIIEFPATTARIFGCNIPIGGGGYFRLFPYSITKLLLTGINKGEKRNFVFYLHPWEIDANIPRIDGVSSISKLRTYTNLCKTGERFKRLLSDFHFTSISGLLKKSSKQS